MTHAELAQANTPDTDTITLDVVLNDGETPDDIVALLNKRFDVRAELDSTSSGAGGHPTFVITGSAQALKRVRRWWNHVPWSRPDLQGKPPVAKGASRT